MAKKNFEFARKIIHVGALCIPLLTLYSLLAAQVLLVFFILLYGTSELLKSKGRHFFLHKLTNKVQRDEEKKTFAKAPLFLAAGVFFSITFFKWESAFVGIYQAGFCDTIAAFAGKKWGSSPILGRKTLAGTFAFFLLALPVAFYFLSPPHAIVISLAGAFLESLPFRDWDNLLVPVVVTILAEQYF